MTSKAGRRRKKAGISLPGEIAAEQSPRQPNGRIKAVDPRKVALDARCRVFGAVDAPEGRRASGEPLYTCAAGRAILSRADKASLWDAICWARKVDAAYLSAIGAPGRHAKVPGILVPPDKMHADASTPAPDMRTPEEVYTHSVAGWARLKGWMWHCDYAARVAFTSAVLDQDERAVVDVEGLVNVLLCIAEGKAGEKVATRDRKLLASRENVIK